MTDSTSNTEAIRNAVLTLAGMCDGAQSRDGAGFNGYDAAFGREMAAAILAGQPINVVRALKVITKYRKQLANAGIELPAIADVQAEADKVRAERAAAAATNAPARDPNAVTITEAGGSLRIAFSYDPAKVEAVKALPGRKFDPTSKSWTVPATSLAAAVAAFPGAVLAGELGAAARAADEAREAAERARVATIAGDLARLASVQPSGLYEHQIDGIRWIVENRRVILADDMGLGKTRQALVAARALGHRIIVVAPAGLRENWIREARAVDARIEVFSWAKVPANFPAPYTIIADEVHYAQNLKAKRTVGFLALAEKAAAVIGLTGTPIKNGRPVNIFPLLKAIGHEVAADKSAFERRYCAAKATKWSKWDVTGAAHLEELHARISDAMLRRMKADCLDLPAKVRVVKKVEMSTAARKVYNQTFTTMQADYRRRVIAGEISTADALVLMNHLRHAGSVAKVESAVEMASEIVEQGGQVVLFTAFLDSAKAIVAELADYGAETITGEVDSMTRTASIDRFQAGESKVIVCTLGAGNVGITLTAAQTVILVDRPWVPGDAMQAEDRCHRIGQRGSVLAVWLQANGADEKIDATLGEKYSRAEMVMSGEAKALDVRGAGSKVSMLALAAQVFGGGAALTDDDSDED